jgi:hypothetical protein
MDEHEAEFGAELEEFALSDEQLDEVYGGFQEVQAQRCAAMNTATIM